MVQDQDEPYVLFSRLNLITKEECDIPNEYPNIRESRKRYEQRFDYIRIERNNTSMIPMSVRIENDMNIQIFVTLYNTEYDFDMNEYPNIFISRKLYERISK